MTKVTKTECEQKWTKTVDTEVNALFKADPEMSQLYACRVVSERLHDLFNSYPGAVGIRVNPKGDKEIQVILTLHTLGDQPSIKIKPRYTVPSLVGEAA